MEFQNITLKPDGRLESTLARYLIEQLVEADLPIIARGRDIVNTLCVGLSEGDITVSPERGVVSYEGSKEISAYSVSFKTGSDFQTPFVQLTPEKALREQGAKRIMLYGNDLSNPDRELVK